jgi:beta-1,4-mannosyl-glycoprotein beta-1,4-N-acetylglucosaminyltransferase
MGERCIYVRGGFSSSDSRNTSRLEASKSFPNQAMVESTFCLVGQMVDHVDYFVILEAAQTFTDEPKPLYVRDNWARFKKYHHKMILHTLDTDGQEFNNTWAVETFSRNAMYDQVIPNLVGEQEAFVGDVILVSDDEIPRPDALETLRNCNFPAEVTLHSKMFYYGFQWQKRSDWDHPQATFYNNEKTILPSDLRSSKGAQLYNAAWHCSYCFSTVEEMITKIQSFRIRS